MDFGLQSYTTLESKLSALGGNLWDMGQNSMRWDVFRLNNLNHSTISINDARHRVNGAATLTTTINTATELGATFDLTMGQNSMRWDVFRLNNLNHSTISINDARHRVNGAATLTTTINTATELGATFDLTEVVSDQAASATRTVKIVNDKDLVVMDEIRARTDKSAKVRWCMVTPAVPTVESNRIVLTNGSKVMYLTASGSVKPTYKQWSTTSENSYDMVTPAVPTVESNRIVLTNGSKVMYLTASGSVKPTYKQWSTTSENSYDQANPGTYMVGFEATVTANQTATFTTTLSPK